MNDQAVCVFALVEPAVPRKNKRSLQKSGGTRSTPKPPESRLAQFMVGEPSIRRERKERW